MPSALAVTGGAAAIGVGLVFLTASVAKLRSRALFPGVVANYRLLPDALVAPVATSLPFTELATGIALIGGSRLAAVPAIAMLLVFAAAMAVNIGRGRAHIDCGCGRSELRQPLSRALVVRNIVLALLLVPTLATTPAFGSAEWLISLAGGLALYLLTHLVNALSALASGPLAAMERNSR
nr:MauE/DoxX family redox-associated membrane protein [Novosphingobium hassiacum]